MGASIQDIVSKFKAFLQSDTVFTALLLIIVAAGSFGLGRVSQGGEMAEMKPQVAAVVLSEPKGQPPVPLAKPEPEPEPVETAQFAQVAGETGEAQYVGSKNGTKFHLLTCPGAKQIKEENKIFFKSKEEAVSKGYTPASNCKGI